jgi:DNA-binding CsgD family transcriptional regulator
MLPWSDLVAPLLSLIAGLPAMTLAYLLWRRTGDRSFELLATGLALLAALALLLSLGIFLMAARLLSNPDLRFVLWNSTFLVSFASLLVLRRFAALIVPGPSTDRAFPRRFTLVSGLVYLLFLVLAFALTPPLLDFSGRGVYALSAAYYLAGFTGPTLRLWRSRTVLPSWVGRLFSRSPLALGLPLAALLVYESLRLVGLLGEAWPSLGPLVAVAFFALVTIELFGILARGDAAAPPASSASATSTTSTTSTGAKDRAARIAARCVADPLTRRELEVLALLLEGWRNGDIAERLGLSPNTVRNHVYSVYQKTGAANRLELTGMGE